MLPTKCIATLKRHKDEVWIIKFSNSGNRLATIGKDNVLVIWQFIKIANSTDQAANNVLNNNKHGGGGRNHHAPPNHKYRIKCTHEIKGHKQSILALNWTNTDDRWLISAGSDKVAHIWDTRTSKPVCELAAHTDTI